MTSTPWTLAIAMGSLLLIGFGPQCYESQCSAEVRGKADYQGPADFGRDVRPLLHEYCYPCHSGDEVHGDVDFRLIISTGDVAGEFETWKCDGPEVHLRQTTGHAERLIPDSHSRSSTANDSTKP